MRKIGVLLVALSLVGSSTALAYGSGHKSWDDPEKKEAYIQKKMDKMTKSLSLDTNQQAKVEVILRTKMDKKYAAKKKMREEMKVLHEEFKTKMSGVLNADQNASLNEMIKEYHAKKGKRHHKKKWYFLYLY